MGDPGLARGERFYRGGTRRFIAAEHLKCGYLQVFWQVLQLNWVRSFFPAVVPCIAWFLCVCMIKLGAEHKHKMGIHSFSCWTAFLYYLF